MNFYDYEAEDAGFEILDFPCNQFGHQAPGTNEEIVSFCDSGFGITFPIFSKIDTDLTIFFLSAFSNFSN
jgi:glutathione peroxidase